MKGCVKIKKSNKDGDSNNNNIFSFIQKKDQLASLKVLEICLDSSLRLLHPLMPFITEVIMKILIKIEKLTIIMIAIVIIFLI